MKIVLPLIIIILVAVLFWDKVFAPNMQTKITSTQNPAAVTTETIKESNTSEKYVLDIQYPKINNQSDPEILKVINKLKQDFLEEVRNNKPIPELSKISSSLTIRYELIRNDDKFVSISFDVSDYQPGMAHPNNFVKTFNYDLTSNKELTLIDIFTKDAGYLKLLSKLTSEDLNKQFKGDPNAKDFISSGTKPDKDNFQNVCISKDGLVILFNPAQVAPSADGVQKSTISWDKFGNTLSQKF